MRYGIDEYVDTAFVSGGRVAKPQSIEKALESKLSKKWKNAADSEYILLVELPNGQKPVGCRWIHKTKHGCDGKVERYKARLVAKRFSQKHEIDYDETFSPVVWYSSVRALLAFAVQNRMMIHQMDNVTAFF